MLSGSSEKIPCAHTGALNSNNSNPISVDIARLAEEYRRLITLLWDSSNPKFASIPNPIPIPDQLVTLDQLAAMVHRSKRTLERYIRKMPDPQVIGGKGFPSLWSWQKSRPWLERTFHIVLPEVFPGRSL